MNDLAPLVLLATAVTLALGLVVARLGYRAYRRTDLPGLRSLSVAVVLVVAGAALGATDLLLGGEAALARLAGSVVTALGFAVLVLALYGDETESQPRTRSHRGEN